MTPAGPSANGSSRAFPGNGNVTRLPVTRPTKAEETERAGLVWIGCRYSVAANGLERILEKEFRVHLGEEPPKEGTPSSVVLYADGVAGLREGIDRARELYPDVPVLIFGTRADLPLAEAALRSGARGFVHADMTPEQLIRALKVATKGEIVAPRELLAYLVTEATDEEAPNLLDDLSPRQLEILELVAGGMSNAEIAQRLYLSESTIKQHLRAAYKLLKVRNRVQAAKLFRRSARAKDPGP